MLKYAGNTYGIGNIHSKQKIKILIFQQNSDLMRLATAQPITLLLLGFHYNTAYTAHTPLPEKERILLVNNNMY
jgi:hypothetical protein